MDPWAIKHTECPSIPTYIWMPNHITVWQSQLCFQLWHTETKPSMITTISICFGIAIPQHVQQSDYSNQKSSSSQITCGNHITYTESDTLYCMSVQSSTRSAQCYPNKGSGTLVKQSIEFPYTYQALKTLYNLIFCWPCIIMHHNNVTNLIHFHYHKHFIVS
jgi:hypothetical protein